MQSNDLIKAYALRNDDDDETKSMPKRQTNKQTNEQTGINKHQLVKNELVKIVCMCV